MNTMKERWICPNMDVQVFTPQEYLAVCEYYMDGVDPVTGTTITSSTKFWIDSGVQGVIDAEDYYKFATNQTDGAGWGSVETLVKAWWADSNKEAEKIYNAGSSEQKYAKFSELQEQKLAGYVDAVVNPGNNHYYAGSIKMSKNNS